MNVTLRGQVYEANVQGELVRLAGDCGVLYICSLCGAEGPTVKHKPGCADADALRQAANPPTFQIGNRES